MTVAQLVFFGVRNVYLWKKRGYFTLLLLLPPFCIIGLRFCCLTPRVWDLQVKNSLQWTLLFSRFPRIWNSDMDRFEWRQLSVPWTAWCPSFSIVSLEPQIWKAINIKRVRSGGKRSISLRKPLFFWVFTFLNAGKIRAAIYSDNNLCYQQRAALIFACLLWDGNFKCKEKLDFGKTLCPPHHLLFTPKVWGPHSTEKK